MRKQDEEDQIFVIGVIIVFLAVLFLLSGAFKLCDMIC